MLFHNKITNFHGEIHNELQFNSYHFRVSVKILDEKSHQQVLIELVETDVTFFKQ